LHHFCLPVYNLVAVIVQRSSNVSCLIFAVDGPSENSVGGATVAEGAATMNEDAACGSSCSAAAPPCRLFTLQIVNSYGSTEVDRLVDDGQPFSFDGKFISRH